MPHWTSAFLALLAFAAPLATAQDVPDPDLPLGSTRVVTPRGIKIIDRRAVPAPTGDAVPLQLRKHPGPADAPVPAPQPLEDTFLLHSRPTATKIIYLDFDGHVGLEPGGTYPPFNFEGDASTFSDAEKTRIQEVWRSVAEDFMPFDVDVTTQQPPTEDLMKTGGGDTRWGIRCVVAPGPWDYSWGYVDSFNWDTDYECQAYTGDNSWIWIADSISHEVGHTLGLDEHGQSPGDGTYYEGHGSGHTYWAPIMGWTKMSVPYGLSQWDKGEYLNADHSEDSLAIITTRNGFGYRPDDHGSTTGTATPVSLPATPAMVAEGVIEQRTDVDCFSFTLTGTGTVSLVINGDVYPSDASHRPSNLDVLARIHNSAGAVLHTSNPANEIHASFNVVLAPGTYSLSIDGTGLNDPSGPPNDGYSDYGSLGYYSITGSTIVPNSNANLANLVPGAGSLIPAFASGICNYTSSVPNATASMTVTPTAADAGATIKVNGATVASGSPAGPISLSVGTNTITTVVTAQDGTTTKTYTLTVSREPDTVPPVIVYQDHFDNDTLAANAGIGGGLGRYSRQPGTLGVYPEGTGTWVDNGQLSGNSTGGNDRGNVYSLNSFLLTGGFKLEVNYSIIDVSNINANRVVIGLLDQIPSPQTDTTYVTHFLAANQDRYGIGLNLTTDTGTQGLNFANDAGAGTLTNLSTAQPIAVGTHTWVLEMGATGNWSYSIDGATPTTGTMAGGFDLARDYHLFAFVHDYRHNQFKVNSVTLSVVPEPSAGFDSWKAKNGATGTLADDHDGDGVPNGVEYFLVGPNGNSSGFTALPSVVKDPVSGALSVTWPKGSGYPGVHPADFVVETSDSLTGSWTSETPAPAGNVTLTAYQVKYTFPSPPGGKKFARLKVTGP